MKVRPRCKIVGLENPTFSGWYHHGEDVLLGVERMRFTYAEKTRTKALAFVGMVAQRHLGLSSPRLLSVCLCLCVRAQLWKAALPFPPSINNRKKGPRGVCV